MTSVILVMSLLRHLKRFLDFDLIFAGNYVYVSQQEFVRAVKAAGIPIVVLYKEGLAPLGSMTSRVNDKLYTGKIFTGDKMLFYNDAIKRALLSANIPGIENSVTSTVGIPRLDPYFSDNGSTADGHKIVLFAFDPARKAFRYVSEETKVAEYIQRGEGFQANVVRFCSQHPEFELVVKTKSGQNAKKSFLEMVARHYVGTIPENVTITATVPASELIRNSGFVAGFTSTTLLEALILDRYLICPQYQGLLPLSETDFFSDFPEVANYVSDYDQLSELLLNQEGLSKAQSEMKEKILKPLIHETDGIASERVYMELMSLLNQN